MAELDKLNRERLAPEKGVLVRRVSGGYALDAGLSAGDVLVELDGQPVRSVADVISMRAGRVDVDALDEPLVLNEFPKYALRRWRTAYVAHAHEKYPYG